MSNNFWRNKNIIITGANGFLASHTTISLLEKGAKVIGVIKEDLPFSFLKIKLREKDYKNLEIIKGNIVDYPFIKKLFKKFRVDFCFHLAAQAIVGTANKGPITTFKTNIQGTWNILEASRIFSPDTKIVVASSDKAYGEHKKLPYTEDSALLALHPYDASKACADILSRTYAHSYNLAVSVARCANIYGPGDFNFSRIIPDTIKSILFNKDPIIRSDGTPLRDYIYIYDAANVYLFLAKSLYSDCKNISGQAFNFGSGKPINVLELVEMIIKISKKTNLIPTILSKSKIKGEIDKQYLSSTKAKKLLGWHCKYTLKKGLTETYNWYKDFFKKT